MHLPPTPELQCLFTDNHPRSNIWYNFSMKINNNTWFYADPNRILLILMIYVKGDMIVLLPFCLVLLLLGFISLKFMVVGFAMYVMLRSLGEMVYWFLQQFVGGKYRPFDYGLRNLDNNAIYILYQLMSLCTAVSAALVVMYILFF